jgi:hypothetical protein
MQRYTQVRTKHLDHHYCMPSSSTRPISRCYTLQWICEELLQTGFIKSEIQLISIQTTKACNQSNVHNSGLV